MHIHFSLRHWQWKTRHHNPLLRLGLRMPLAWIHIHWTLLLLLLYFLVVFLMDLFKHLLLHLFNSTSLLFCLNLLKSTWDFVFFAKPFKCCDWILIFCYFINKWARIIFLDIDFRTLSRCRQIENNTFVGLHISNTFVGQTLWKFVQIIPSTLR